MPPVLQERALPPTSRFSSSRPLVTVVTPSYNQGKFIERTIRSVLCQDYPNIQYVVLDSMSNDETRGILKRYSKYISRVVREKDKGQSFAIDRGFAETSGEIMTWINSDDCYASPSVISQAVAHLNSNPETDMIYGRRLYVDANGRVCIAYPFRNFCEEQFRISDFIPQECCFWTREIYDKAGGCIDTTFDFAMDYELFMRFLSAGAKFEAVNSVFGLFRYYQDQKSRSLWEKVGIPEVARIHEKYCNGEVPDVRMQRNFVEHFWGVSEKSHPRTHRLYHQLRVPFVEFAHKSHNIASHDRWMFQREISPTPRG